MARSITRHIKKHGTYILATVIPAIVAILTIITLFLQLANKDERIAVLEGTIQSMQQAECAKHSALQSYVKDLNSQIINIGKALRNLFRENRISTQIYANLENALKEVSANSLKMTSFLDDCEVANKKLTISDSSASWIRIARSREDSGIVATTAALRGKFAGFNKAIDQIKNRPRESEDDFKQITDGVDGCFEALRNINGTITNYKEVNGPRSAQNSNYLFGEANSPSSLSGLAYQRQVVVHLGKDYERGDWGRNNRLGNQIMREKGVISNYLLSSSATNSTDSGSQYTSLPLAEERIETTEEIPTAPLQSEKDEWASQRLSISTELSQEAIKDSMAKIQSRLKTLGEKEKTYKDVHRQGKENIVALGMQAFSEMVRIEKEAKQAKRN